MKISENTHQLQQVISQSEHVTLITPDNPREDIIYTVLAWKNILENQSKKVDIYAPKLDTKSHGGIKDIDSIQDALPGRRTVVRVQLGDAGISKINYEVKDSELYLYLTPKSGLIKGEQVDVTTDSLKTDAIITIGLTHSNQVSQWPADWPKQVVDDVPLVNIDVNSSNGQFGKINIIESNFSSVVGLSGTIFKDFEWEVPAAASTYLYQGIVSASDHFSKNITPELFELAAFLLRHNASVQEEKQGNMDT